MNDKTTTIEELKQKMRSFVEERNWQQFHTPKNLTMALAVEAAELMEIFMWTDSARADKKLEKDRTHVEQEVADIACFLLSLCAYYDIDLAHAFESKLQHNAEGKYTLEKSKEVTKKLTEF